MIIHISIINIAWSYISQSNILIFSRSRSRSTSASHQTISSNVMYMYNKHILQSHNGLEHIFVPCRRGGNWGFHWLKTLKFQNFSGRCPEPRWGAHSAPTPPAGLVLCPPVTWILDPPLPFLVRRLPTGVKVHTPHPTKFNFNFFLRETLNKSQQSTRQWYRIFGWNEWMHKWMFFSSDDYFCMKLWVTNNKTAGVSFS